MLRWLPGEDPREFDENGARFIHLIGLDPDADGIVTWPQLDTGQGYLVSTALLPFLAESLTVKDSIYHLDGRSSVGSPKYRFVVRYSEADTCDTLR